MSDGSHIGSLYAGNQPHRHRSRGRPTVEEAVAAWRTWSPAQRAEFGRSAGVAELWDHAIIPGMAPMVVTDTSVTTMPTTKKHAEVVS